MPSRSSFRPVSSSSSGPRLSTSRPSVVSAVSRSAWVAGTARCGGSLKAFRRLTDRRSPPRRNAERRWLLQAPCRAVAVRSPVGPRSPARPLSPARQGDDLVGQALDFGTVMADVQDGYAQFVAHALDHPHDFLTPRGVERCERLVHQQHAGAREQRPSNGHALGFASREMPRHAIEQVLDAKKRDRIARLHPPAFRRHEAPAEQQVLSHGTMWKKPVVLEHVPTGALFGRKVHPVGTVEQHLFADCDAPALGRDQTGNGIEHAGFARARGAEQRGEAVPGLDRSRDYSLSARDDDVEFKAHRMRHTSADGLTKPENSGA
ncbi:hypothetical protein NOVOSPHI9U_10354 [Novosphingobium sp. 9U]|nr:hypothetical protein NOVOSPHI9U_10354 [Novosphingobium sp. 9U]